ncbi:hypothetical protein [Brevifollis gellanilyticus]|nr:hypothetical protein [Brevifollis gellanilyticus]
MKSASAIALILTLAFLALLLTSAVHAADKGPQTFVIEALIDGPSELRVKKNGIYWVNGPNAKPGRHNGQEFPTFVDGKPWRPNWKESRGDRGNDKSATRSVDRIDPTKIEFKLVMVSFKRDGTGIEKRDAIKAALAGEEYSIEIPDLQSGSRWYRFELIQKP